MSSFLYKYTTSDYTSNRTLQLFYNKKNKLAKHFLKVKHTCTLYLGMEGSIYEKKNLNFFDPKGAEGLYIWLIIVKK